MAVCYLEGHSPITKVREVYDHRIWKELERTDAIAVEVFSSFCHLFNMIHNLKLQVFTCPAHLGVPKCFGPVIASFCTGKTRYL